MGYGSSWRRVRAQRAEMDLITVLPFGYRPDDFKGRGIPRKPLAEMVHFESFGRHSVA